jgi:diaminohydroxyphosphoribosylaminopyrimidine deaminase/5-amino-6-(5-phosphoribosylamino)uracil reductase
LIAAGIARVVAAVADPNPVAVGGAGQLRAAGIPVEFGVMAEAARRMNAPFFHQHSAVDRPWTMLKLALSLDGRIADAGGRSRWITGVPARDWVQWLRAGFDAIGVGGATARLDDPQLTARGRIVPRIPPRRVVFAGRAGIPATLRVVAGASETGTIIVAPPEAAGRADWERAGASTIEAVDLGEAMRQLRQAGIASLLVEGGGRLAGGLLAAGLVDRCAVIQAPIFLGEAGVPAVAGLRPALPDAAPWQVVERRALGVDSLLTLEPT